MILAKQINAMISQENVDAETAMKKVAELETLVAQAKEVSKDSMNSLFIGAADRYQIAAKKYARRIRDNVPYSDSDKRNFRTQPPTGWLRTLTRNHYALITNWSVVIIACVKRF